MYHLQMCKVLTSYFCRNEGFILLNGERFYIINVYVHFSKTCSLFS